MSEEPQPCPFCGSPHVDVWDALPVDHIYNVKCVPEEYSPLGSIRSKSKGFNCGLTGPEGGSREEAIAAWNRLAVVPEGWRLVPRQADQNQCEVGEEVWKECEGRCVVSIYDEMVAAAPDPQEGQE